MDLLEHKDRIRGYKIFDKNWTCDGIRFEWGRFYSYDGEIDSFGGGYVVYLNKIECLKDCVKDLDSTMAEVYFMGDSFSHGGSKYSVRNIVLFREVDWWKELDLINTGKDCMGIGNSGSNNLGNFNTGCFNGGNCNGGDYNTGNHNTGHYNAGNLNTGNKNDGHLNTGAHNGGNFNTGDKNLGDSNSGDENEGNFNSGDHNLGDHNSGARNVGNYNTGSANVGDYNCGCNNTGNYNTGDYNLGDHNTGKFNEGDFNSGYFNAGDYNVGLFNRTDAPLYMFNVKTDWTFKDWNESEARRILMEMPVSRFNPGGFDRDVGNMVDDAVDGTDDVVGGNEDSIVDDSIVLENQGWWDMLTEEDREMILSLPNFNSKIFRIITGIDVGCV